VVVVAGCDEVGSAIAHALHIAGFAVVLVDDIDPGHIRRGRSYTDAWYVGGATLDGVDACFCGSVKSIPAVLARGDMIAATTWSMMGVAAALRPHALVETRPGCRAGVAAARPPVLDGALAVGVRTTRVAGWRADVVIAAAFDDDSSASQQAMSRARGRDRTRSTPIPVEVAHGGRFRTRREIPERVDVGDVLGDLDRHTIVAPASGVLAGLAARGARIAAGQPVAEIDPAGEPRQSFGIGAEERAIARRACAAVRSDRPKSEHQGVGDRSAALA
jgi:xanthine dehydrogenase accessory factor